MRRTRTAGLPARLALVALGVLLLAAVLPADALAAPTWLAPGDISGAGHEAYEPQVAMNADGDSVAVWWVYDGSYVVQAATRPAGGSWSVPVDLSVAGHDSPLPQVAIDAAGGAVAVWRQYGGTDEVIQAATLAAGGAWSAPVDLSEPAMYAYEPQVAIDPAGDAVAIWSVYDGASDVVESRTMPAGGTWRAPVQITADGDDADGPQIAINPAGETVAVWYRANGTNDVVQSASGSVDGPWGPITELSLAGQNAWEPQVAIDPAGEAVATWDGFDGSDYIAQTASKGAGEPWGVPTDLSTPGADTYESQVAIDPAGEAVAVWWRIAPGENVVQAASRSAAGSWKPSVDLSIAGEAALGPRVAIDPAGDAVAIWERAEVTNHFVETATRTGGDWGTPTEISTVSHDSDRPQIAVDAGGDAVATWGHYDGHSYTVQADGYDVAGPQLRGLSIPASGTVGTPLSFSVSPLDVWSAVGATTWSFGDGGSAVGTSVSHTFAGPGTYTVKVSSTDAVGNTSTATGTVTVGAEPSKPGGTGPHKSHPKKGEARAQRVVKVEGGVALLALSCRGRARCAGTARLAVVAKTTRGATRSARRSPKPIAIGKATFNLSAGRHKTIKLPLTKKGRALVAAAGRRGLTARLLGSDVVGRAVRLEAVGHRRHR
ncbi:MAG TPA: PKD domain-containing protein [Solirubrobacterales bacterium]|nr:PKD domain-containing protein [Solirubrobacterales bacterium]